MTATVSSVSGSKLFKRVFLIFVIALLAFAGWEWLTFPDVGRLRSESPKTTAFMERRKALLRGEGKDGTLDYRWVSYGRISPNLRRAVLVAEDSAFYEHQGVDVEGLKEALRRDWEKKKLTHGGSTITQQLAKNLYLSPSRNPYRKLKEYVIARELERKLSKKQILEIYLNVVELGERTYGAEAAARHYFGKSAASLTPSEAALLAGSLPNPRVMSPANPNRRLRARQKLILSRMKRWGYQLEKDVLTEPKARTRVKEETPPPSDTDLVPEEPLPEMEPLPSLAPPLEEPPAVETEQPAPVEPADVTTTEIPPPIPPM
ncbi:MAG TPA: monofunctional biosynthetic peptidoglycan transglycosylase [Thermoanaerobaculia bacterium]|nr:monofunctional biosynthetic peptidoglycan transglycosylase [Thermoanaerobaculia bacterium]